MYVGRAVFMGLYRVVLTSTRALAPLRFQFSGDIKRHALDGRVGFFPDFFSGTPSGVARIRARDLRKHTHTHTQTRTRTHSTTEER